MRLFPAALDRTSKWSARMLLRAIALIAVLAALPTPQSEAAIIAYANRAVFESVIQNPQTITFESQENGDFTWYGNGLNVGGVQFNVPNAYLYVASDSAVNPAYQWNSGATLLFGSTNEGGSLQITLAAGTTAFGLDFMAQSDQLAQTGVAAPFTFTVNGGPTFNATSLLRPNRAFFGITSDVAISTITITMTNPVPQRSLPIIDNVTTGQAVPQAAVPEPATMTIWGLGALGCAAAAYRRRKRAA